ncbi:hypothetical protein GCM10009575_031120 [Streptomyces rhizosphaericus]|uniref:Uncharacterized protein n=1 Tax=Streptomyces rhizosphaericus TaxID=114699 RepID=A0ABN1PIV7_9ACTN
MVHAELVQRRVEQTVVGEDGLPDNADHDSAEYDGCEEHAAQRVVEPAAAVQEDAMARPIALAAIVTATVMMMVLVSTFQKSGSSASVR